MSSTSIRVVPPAPPEVVALNKSLTELAQQSALDRFEIAVKSRLAMGIKDDNDLRIVDDMLHQIVLGSDGVDAAAKPMVSAAHALHKALIAAAKPWKDRWEALKTSLDRMILQYNRAKAELARRQQAEIDKAVEAERKRKEDEARLALRSGNMAAAKAAIQEAQTIVAPVIMSGAPVLDNSSTRQVWEVAMVDPLATCRAILAGELPTSVVKEWNMKFFKDEAARRGGLPTTWGVSAKQESALTHHR